MRETIRQGVFETNSSSMHSIVISLEDFPQRDYSSYVLHGGFYGWGHATLDTIQDRLDYLWQAVLDLTSEYDSEWVPHATEATQEWRKRIENVLPNLEDGEIDEDGGIDHADELREWLDWLAQDERMLSAYLLGDKSLVSTSNDNDDLDGYGFVYPDGPYFEFVKGN